MCCVLCAVVGRSLRMVLPFDLARSGTNLEYSHLFTAMQCYLATSQRTAVLNHEALLCVLSDMGGLHSLCGKHELPSVKMALITFDCG